MSIVFSLVCNLVSAQVMDVTATLKVINYVNIAIDSKQCWAAIFLDLAKGFDTGDHSIPVGRLRSIGVSEGGLGMLTTSLKECSV